MANNHIKRLRYFTGQYLEEADFQAEQLYHIGHRRRANQILWLKAGILDNGFLVQRDPNDPNKSTSILITKGVGVDQEGREIVFLDDQLVPLPQTEGQKVVILSYSEEQTDQQLENQDVSDNTRWQEVPRVSFADDLPEDRSQLIVLALVKINADGELASEPDLSVRQIAAARLPGDLTIGQGGNGFLRTRHIDGKDFSNDNLDHLYLNYATNKDVYLGFGNGTRSSLYVSGKLGVGTLTPNARLEIDMQASNDVALRLSSSGPGWGSGIQFRNTAAGGGRTFGIYSNPQGELHFADEDARESRLVIDSQKRLRIGGVLMPSVGNDDSAGILFPLVPGGGSGDKAFIRYFVESGESTKLLIGCDNDTDDRISLWQQGAERLTIYGGNIGIGTTTPGAGKLQFANEPGNKIVVWDEGITNRYGFGLNGLNLNAFFPNGGRFSLRLNGFNGPEMLTVDDKGRIGTNRLDPHSGPGFPWWDRWGGGIHTWDLIADGSVWVADKAYCMGVHVRGAGMLEFKDRQAGDKIVVYDDGTDRYGIGLAAGNLYAFVPQSGRFSIRQNGLNGDEVFSVGGNGSLFWNNNNQVSQKFILLGSLLICWGSETIGIKTPVEKSYIEHRQIVYPRSFSQPPAVSTSLDDPGYGISAGDTFVGVYQASNTGFKLTTKRIAFPLLVGSQKDGSINVGWIAIGPS